MQTDVVLIALALGSFLLFGVLLLVIDERVLDQRR